jgi:acetyl-CoA acetyltransferase
MREVVVLGVGMHKFGRFPGKEYYDMGRDAIVRALEDSGIEWKDVQALYCGHSYAGMGAGGNILAQLGLTGIPVFNVELGCACGSSAMGLAYQAIATGLLDVACAVGVEKMPRGMLPAENFPHWLRVAGIGIHPVVLALQAQRRMKEYGITREQLAKVSIKSHNNAALCPYAHYQDNANMTVEDVLKSRMVCDPITVMQIAPVSEGAAAAILCAKEVLKEYPRRNSKPITIAAFTSGTARYVHPYSTLNSIPQVCKGGKDVVRKAYEAAGCGPEDLDIAQVEDAYTIVEMESCEVIGICGEGEMGKLVDDGATLLDGRIPVNTDGGILSRGNCIGGCALASIAETVWQLRNEAGPRQVAGAKIGLAYSTGVPSSATATILKR